MLRISLALLCLTGFVLCERFSGSNVDRDTPRGFGSDAGSRFTDRDRTGSRGSSDDTSFFIRDSTRDRTNTGSSSDSSFFTRDSARDRNPSGLRDTSGNRDSFGSLREPTGGRDASGTRDGSGSRDTFNIRDGSRDSGRNSGSFGSRDSFTGGSAPSDNNFVRVVASLVLFDNPNDFRQDGKKCDSFSKCDPIVYYDLDTRRPNANWPGPRPEKNWNSTAKLDNTNRIEFNENQKLIKDICGEPYREANLRVSIQHRNVMLSNDIINQWDCPITRTPDRALSEREAPWSQTMRCLPKKDVKGQNLTYRYKLYYIRSAECRTDDVNPNGR